MKIFYLDTFTTEKYGGNRAAVAVVDQYPPEKEMQNIANEIGFSETAFARITKNNEVEVRFFTPLEEVDLCGHATIATFHILTEKELINWEEKEVTMIAKAGKLRINRIREEKGNIILMEQAKPVVREKISDDEVLESLLNSLGLSKDELGMLQNESFLPQPCYTGLWDIICPVKTIESLKNIKPKFELLSDLSKDLDVVGVHCICVEKNNNGEVRVWARNFAPLVGIDEEPATGTSSGAAAAYLIENKFINYNERTTFIFSQGQWMGRPSEITVTSSKNEDDYEIWVGGKAVTVMEGLWK